MVLDYTLAILTHGRSRTLEQTIRSFLTKVKPYPTRTIIHYDGTERAPRGIPEGLAAERHIDSEQRGFCAATGKLWRWAADEETEYVFWLEHDFVFLKPVDLRELAHVADTEKSVCQMQLMRTPVSREEIAAGGLYEMRQGEYEREAVWFDRFAGPPGELKTPHEMYERNWLRHRSYFTTNPSLMRSKWMALNPWPTDGLPFCEGRFSIGLVEEGFSFGVWGAGEPWVQHTGVRDGTGY